MARRNGHGFELASPSEMFVLNFISWVIKISLLLMLLPCFLCILISLHLEDY